MTSWCSDEPVTGPFARPSGTLGRLAGRFMAVSNGRSAREVAGRVPLRPGQRVLEIGFGPGVLLAALAARSEAPRLVGVEPSAEMHGLARRRVPAAELRAGTADRTGTADASVDHVVSVNTIALWPDLAAGLDEIRRVLRPGGSVLLGWHSRTARSRLSRPMGLPDGVLDRIDAALRLRWGQVERVHLSDQVLHTATTAGPGHP